MVAAANLDQAGEIDVEAFAPFCNSIVRVADISGLLLHWTPLQLRWLITKPRRSDPRNTTSITMPREINAQDKLLAAGAIEETW